LSLICEPARVRTAAKVRRVDPSCRRFFQIIPQGRPAGFPPMSPAARPARPVPMAGGTETVLWQDSPSLKLLMVQGVRTLVVAAALVVPAIVIQPVAAAFFAEPSAGRADLSRRLPAGLLALQPSRRTWWRPPSPWPGAFAGKGAGRRADPGKQRPGAEQSLMDDSLLQP
jgi:hypothetical protein